MQNRFYNSFDLERQNEKPSGKPDARTPFQIDRDRIIYTSAFRRLQAKTQVFLSGEYDFYRTRLTHSIEVAQIGRSICHHLRHQQGSSLANDFFIDADLVEAICLTHDLGHPPFGHAGERTLHRLMSAEFDGFEGNAQSLRIIAETIFSKKEGRRGMNPTRAFLDGILKYKTCWNEIPNAENHFVYDAQQPLLEFAFGEADFANRDLVPGKKRNEFRSIECQIMDWADDTAYSLNDIVDGIRAGFITLEKVRHWHRKNCANHELSQTAELIRILRRGSAEAAFGRMIGDFVQAVSLKPRENFLSKKTNRYAFDLTIDSSLMAKSEFYKKLANDLVFKSSQLHQIEHKSDYLLSRIFEAFANHYLAEATSGIGEIKLLPATWDQRIRVTEKREERARLLCDYIAGMTDGFAVRTHKRLFDPDFLSIAGLTS